MSCFVTREVEDEQGTDRLSFYDRVTIFIGSVGGVLLADHMMWRQYVHDVGDLVNQTDIARNVNIRTSLRRMSRAVLALESKVGKGAVVLPKEREAVVETTGSSQSDGDTNEGGLARVMATLGNTLVIIVVAVGYPVSILPYYRAQTTTE